jgi:vancomycin resistance protein YoaR
MGGGVCQLSSTLYSAAEKAKLEIIERHAHSRAVGYIPEGRDAAISYGYLDLRFKNNRDYPIEIKAWLENNEVHVSIYMVK